MHITKDEIKKNSEKFNLNKENFLFIEKKTFFMKKFYLIYRPYQFFFQVDKNNNDMSHFFPYFCEKKEYSNIESWCSSIKETLIKSNKIVKGLKESKDLRDQFKEKYKV